MIEAVGESPGLVGARQTGAGFGGCTVALVEGERVEEFTAEAAARYHRATGTRPAIYAVQPSPGAGAVSELL
jgi:galactokinase